MPYLSWINFTCWTRGWIVFDKVGYELLKSHLVGLVNSPLQYDFDYILESARNLLSALPQRNGEVETELTTFAGRRKCYTFHCLEQTPCNRHKKGNAASKLTIQVF